MHAIIIPAHVSKSIVFTMIYHVEKNAISLDQIVSVNYDKIDATKLWVLFC